MNKKQQSNKTPRKQVKDDVVEAPIAAVKPVVETPVVEDPVVKAGDLVTDSVKADLDDYEACMKIGGSSNIVEGARRQNKLYNQLMNILRLEGGAFVTALSTTLEKVAEYKDSSFQDKLIFRHTGQIGSSKKDADSFINLVTLLKATCVMGDRSRALKSIDFNRVIVGKDAMVLNDKLNSFFTEM